MAGIFILVALDPFGLRPRVAGALLAPAAGVAAGFMKIKGLSPERYLFHRGRFAVRRQGLGVWQVPNAPVRHVEVELQAPAQKRRASQGASSSASLVTQPRRATPPRPTPTARRSECTVQASPFGLGFYVAALGAMGAAMVYLAGRPIP